MNYELRIRVARHVCRGLNELRVTNLRAKVRKKNDIRKGARHFYRNLEHCLFDELPEGVYITEVGYRSEVTDTLADGGDGMFG